MHLNFRDHRVGKLKNTPYEIDQRQNVGGTELLAQLEIYYRHQRTVSLYKLSDQILTSHIGTQGLVGKSWGNKLLDVLSAITSFRIVD